ncbi:hypothetical protein [Mycobacterium sp. MS1601]|uniref:hypothetical protein n=1 Tax=Mycobacterium sp. MS1601 TaxID=1936029 RepID=UPI0012FA7B5E|nr:hypothetical protein [Mycobacterium sp. MS1601]
MSAYDAAVRRDELAMAKRGANLLLGHLKGSADSIDTAMVNQDTDALIIASGPLVTVAAILVRMFRDAADKTLEDTLLALHAYLNLEIVPVDQLEQVERLVTTIISQGFCEPISVNAAGVALIAHEFALGAASEISKLDGRHLNKVLADVHVQLKNQGDDVQITDRASARAASDKYAEDPIMRNARQTAAYALVDYWHRAAVVLHKASSVNGLQAECKDSLDALALVAVTNNALTAGVYQLASYGNVYPAWTLIRQLVETEFILWRFMADASQMAKWANSTPGERRQNWKPSKIYRDDDNDYRQKDYWQHCELGGHPTPTGGWFIAAPNSYVPMAGTFTECIAHSWDAWQHLIKAGQSVDEQFSTCVWDELDVIDTEFRATIEQWVATDYYRRTSGFFSDPID